MDQSPAERLAAALAGAARQNRAARIARGRPGISPRAKTRRRLELQAAAGMTNRARTYYSRGLAEVGLRGRSLDDRQKLDLARGCIAKAKVRATASTDALMAE